MTYYQFRGEKRVQRPSLQFSIVDFMDQHTAAYRLDGKSSVRFYLRIFFDLMDIACVNSYLIYNMKPPNKFFLLEYKIVVAKNLIQYPESR